MKLKFLPYQNRWLKDDSRIKVWEKSRRIGATYVQSYEDVFDCVRGNVPAVWFSSADESAAREYILYCEAWAKLFKVGLETIGDDSIVDERKGLKSFTIEFKGGARITALSSNPKGFRSKGGKVVLDEYAHHEDQEALFRAAQPSIMWGYPLRILSTHNGTACRFYKLIEGIKAKRQKGWSLHTTPIQLAVDDGLYDAISQRKTSQAERKAWLEQLHQDCVDEETWLQEYCCVAANESEAFLTYEMLAACEAEGILRQLSECTGELYLGADIGRKKDLTVFVVLEKVGSRLFTRAIIELERTAFSIQRQILYDILRHPRFRRGCIDETGIGMQFAQEAAEQFGKTRVEPVMFTGKVKEDLAFGLRTMFEDKGIIIPPSFDLREDLHSIRKVTTVAGNLRFDVSRSDTNGHADRFWALALAVHAAATGSKSGPVELRSMKPAISTPLLRGYW
ncbi:MAG: hypothetical protein GX410_01785 [Elusimicrobia bacterium]|nr:hypothetical protein [Elusimicrobiota bacterium]